MIEFTLAAAPPDLGRERTSSSMAAIGWRERTRVRSAPTHVVSLGGSDARMSCGIDERTLTIELELRLDRWTRDLPLDGRCVVAGTEILVRFRSGDELSVEVVERADRGPRGQAVTR